MFAISADPARRLVEVKVSGLLSLAEVRALEQEHLAIMERHGLTPGNYALLCDATEFVIQTQEVHEALDVLGHDPRLAFARTAILTGTTAHRMQVRRASPPCPMALFDNRAEAIEWLCTAQPDHLERRAA